MLAFIDPAASRAEIERGMTLPRMPFVTALFRVKENRCAAARVLDL
jgi:hypothetical protein